MNNEYFKTCARSLDFSSKDHAEEIDVGARRAVPQELSTIIGAYGIPRIDMGTWICRGCRQKVVDHFVIDPYQLTAIALLPFHLVATHRNSHSYVINGIDSMFGSAEQAATLRDIRPFTPHKFLFSIFHFGMAVINGANKIIRYPFVQPSIQHTHTKRRNAANT